MASTHDYRKWMRKGDSPGDAADTSVNVSRRDPPAANQPLSSDSASGALHPEKSRVSIRVSITLGNHGRSP